ncbi:unnamed protein product [Rotaria sordida]|uniref:RRM domain-containing protein n=1 Tax=Rotaria sordida TaxID=392033 RepID=A0A814ZGP2_9BILA|nr:unnamed protein product [Rotaria sordida]
MNSNLIKSSIENVSLCVYIGNTCSFDDEILINYCSQYGEIKSCSIDKCPYEKRLFCDYRIIEFANKQQLEYFLNKSLHEIDSIKLDIKLYKNLLDNNDILNIDRKIFIGPIFNSNDINLIVEFYKIIDPRLEYNISKQDKQIYILFEFSNREYVRTIIQQKTILKTIDNQIFTIHKAINPIEFIKKKISVTNSQYQICINGLNDKITETMLIDYFDKRASVVACHILSIDRKRAIIEFENEKFVQKFLDMRFINFNGINLSLNKVSNNLTSVSPSNTTIDNQQQYNNDHPDYLHETTRSNIITSDLTHPSPIRQNQTILTDLSTVQQVNSYQQPQQQSISTFNCQPSPLVTEPISDSSPDINECGWSSPPRNVINHCLPINQSVEHVSSNPCLRTMNINIDQENQTRIIETDTKLIKNDILKFIEQFQNEIDQIKDEYMIKYTKDRTNIEHEMNRLINDQRITFNKVKRYLYDNRRRSNKSHDYQRKHI